MEEYTSSGIHKIKTTRKFKEDIEQLLSNPKRDLSTNKHQAKHSLIIIAGPNGAGKSQYVENLFQSSINWDEDIIFKDLKSKLNNSEFSYLDTEIETILSELRKDVYKLVLKHSGTMTFHTNFSTDFLRPNALENFFGQNIKKTESKLVFIDTVLEGVSEKRVKRRVNEEGHPVSKDVIKQNFELSIKNLRNYFHDFSIVQVFTNALDIEDTKGLISDTAMSSLIRKTPLIEFKNNQVTIHNSIFDNNRVFKRYAQLIKHVEQETSKKGRILSINIK